MKRVRKRILLTLAVCALLPVFRANAQPIENATIEREEYAVYSAIIPETYHNEEGGILIIANPTWHYSDHITKKDFQFFYPSPIVSQETLDDFVQRNKTNRWLERKFQLDFAYVIADFSDIKRLIDKPLGDWQDFFKVYPASHG